MNKLFKFLKYYWSSRKNFIILILSLFIIFMAWRYIVEY